MARSGLNFRPIFGHPFFVATLFVHFVAWWTTFIGSILAELAFDSPGSAVGVAWFAVLLELVLAPSVFCTLAADSIEPNRLALALWDAVALVFAVLGANIGIYAETGALKAVGAGSLLLAMVNTLWLLYFSSHEDSSVFHLLNAFSSGGFSATARAARVNHRRSRMAGTPQAGGGISNISFPSTANHATANGANLGPYGAGGIKAAESSASMTSLGGFNQAPTRLDSGRLEEGNAHGPRTLTSTSIDSTARPPSAAPSTVPKARALYAYTASPDDPNEIGFAKGEILEILDNSGKWWQARRIADGTTGLAPSNYLQAL